MKLFLAMVGVLVILSSCSNRLMYSIMSGGSQTDCTNLQGEKRLQCLKDTGLSYDDYERERLKLLNEK